jgi:catechol 2,3-dioxygenase-like lactoylglutathione lyase family enzyme
MAMAKPCPGCKVVRSASTFLDLPSTIEDNQGELGSAEIGVQRSGPASMIDTGGGGINGHITALGHEPHHYVNIYVQVDDLRAYLAKAESLGGKTLVPPVDLPTGSFAWFADPDGNTIGLWKPKP